MYFNKLIDYLSVQKNTANRVLIMHSIYPRGAFTQQSVSQSSISTLYMDGEVSVSL